MAQPYFLPSKDGALATFSANFSTLITSSPASFSLLVGDATALAALVASYTTALSGCQTPNTRTPTSVMAKDTARAQMRASIQVLAKKIQSSLSVTAAQKISLGITVPDHVRTPAAPPVTRPLINVLDMAPLTFGLRLTDEATPHKRKRPANVDGADLWTFVGISGATPPIDLAAWTYQGRVRKADYTLTFSGTLAGQVAHMRAKWVSTRGDAGPVSADLVRNIAA